MIAAAVFAAVLLPVLSACGYGRRGLWFGLLLASLLLTALFASMPAKSYGSTAEYYVTNETGPCGTILFSGCSLGFLIAAIVFRGRQGTTHRF